MAADGRDPPETGRSGSEPWPWHVRRPACPDEDSEAVTTAAALPRPMIPRRNRLEARAPASPPACAATRWTGRYQRASSAGIKALYRKRSQARGLATKALMPKTHREVLVARRRSWAAETARGPKSSKAGHVCLRPIPSYAYHLFCIAWGGGVSARAAAGSSTH
jgi:hypothetical protein